MLDAASGESQNRSDARPCRGHAPSPSGSLHRDLIGDHGVAALRVLGVGREEFELAAGIAEAVGLCREGCVAATSSWALVGLVVRRVARLTGHCLALRWLSTQEGLA